MQRSMRLKKEMKMIVESPPHGISCWPVDDNLDLLEAKIIGADDTPFCGGVFKLEIQIPDRYPFEPPKVRFTTPIYHPNIDTGGRICLDTLKMPPKGAWKPCLNISTVLTSIQLLMGEPNPEDPLMTDISNEFKHNRAQFERTAREWTEKHAKAEDKCTKLASASEMDCENRVDPINESKPTKQHNTALKRTQPMQDRTNKVQRTGSDT